MDRTAFLTKSEVVKRVGGRRERAWAIVEQLLADGVVVTQKNESGHSVCVPASWAGTRPEHAPEHMEHAINGEIGNKAGTDVPRRTSGRTTSAGPINNREAPQRTGADKPGGLALVTEPRCRCCRDPDLRDRINRMIAGGFSLRAIYESLAAVNASLPSKRRVTMDSLETHRSKHFNVQMGASAVWRTILEERAAAEAETYQQGVNNLVTYRAFLEIVVAKSYAGLTDGAAQVSVSDGIAAARELSRLVADDDEHLRWARVHADQARIVEAMRSLPPPYQQQVMDIIDGKTGPALAVIEGGSATDTDYVDPFDDDSDLDEDDD